jgi:vacuolar-type H+-ATPase subunit H
MIAMAQRFIDQAQHEAETKAREFTTAAQDRAREIVNEARSRAEDEVNRLNGLKQRLSEDVETLATNSKPSAPASRRCSPSSPLGPELPASQRSQSRHLEPAHRTRGRATAGPAPHPDSAARTGAHDHSAHDRSGAQVRSVFSRRSSIKRVADC